MAILTVIWEKWIEFKHEWIKITISSLITPLLYLITFGLGIGNFITTGDRPYLQFLIPGIIALTTMNSSFNAVGMSLNVQRLYEHSFDSIMASPTPLWQYIIGQMIGGSLRGMYAGTLILIISLLFSVQLCFSIWFFGIPVVILYSIVLFFVIRKYVDKISEKYSKLREATSKIAQGKLDVNIEEDLGLFEPFKEDLKEIQKGFKKAVDEEVKSQKMKTDLISNVSHDLKTPLTAIITYADLLKGENLSEEKRKQYVDTLDRKAQRLQVLIEDLFEMSKATSGNITLNIENIDVVALMKQTLLELEDKLEEAKLSVRKNMPEGKVILPLDSQRTFRVFENLVINMTKYAMPNSRVFIDIFENENDVQIVMKNMAAEEITFNVDTIAERFVRGDESRNTEGSGLGLAIAKSFVELQNGKFNISVDGDLFKVTIIFEK